MARQKKKIIVLALILLLVLTIKISMFSDKKISNMEERLNKNPLLADVEAYLYMSDRFSSLHFLSKGEWNDSDAYIPNVYYKFPPLYPVLLTPHSLFDTASYIVILGELLATLTIIPLFLLIKKISLSFYPSLIVAIIPVFFFPFTALQIYRTGGIGLPTSLFIFIFAFFIYFLYAKKVFLSGLCFGLLIMTHYIAIYLVPMIIIWMMIRKWKVKNAMHFLVFPIVMLSIWLTRNAFVHGLSITGIFGGYACYFDRFFIYPSLISTKIVGLFQVTELPSIAQYLFISIYLWFCVMVIFVLKDPEKKIKQFYKVMAFNLFFFFFATGFMYGSSHINYKFLLTIFPIYVAIAYAILIKHYTLIYRKARRLKYE